MVKRRIGAYGGTFDPIHSGHIDVARQVVRNFRLDQLLIIPAHRPPHKTMRSVSDSYDRYAMAVLATMPYPEIAVSTVELQAPERPYTFETIETLGQIYDEAELFFVMGSDSFAEVLTWKEPARVLESADWIVVTRPGCEISTSHLPSSLKTRIVDLRGGLAPSDERPRMDGSDSVIFLTDYVNRDISSTQIREMVEAKLPIDGLVPTPVASYIEKYQLYRQ